jgi:4-hydroxybenzoate polyprenyltransferase
MWHAVLMLFAWMFLRIFFEGILETTHRIGYIPFSYKALVIFFIHYPAFYLSLFLILTIITALITGEPVTRISRTFATCFGITLLVPIIDSLTGGGYVITYPLRIEPYLWGSINPFVSITEYGGSPGQRIVFFFICASLAIYGYIKTRKLLAAVALFITSYLAIILLGGLPTLIAGNVPEQLYITGGILYSDTQKFSALFIILLLGALFGFLFLNHRNNFKLLIASIRLERAFFYGGIGIFGVVLALHQLGVAPKNQFPYLFDWIGFIILWLCLALGFQGAAALNDFFDRRSDNITRTRNPLTKGMSPQYYFCWTVMIIGLSIACSALINYTAFLTVLSLILLSIVYSVPPVRLKRIPVVSSFTLAVATMLAMAVGYSIIAGSAVFDSMPGSIVAPTLIGVTLGFIAKDIKDIEGDRAAHVITLPILFGMDRTKIRRIPIALMISASYVCYAFFINELLPAALVFAVITFAYTIIARRAHEWFYFIVLYMFGAYIIFLLGRLPVLD